MFCVIGFKVKGQIMYFLVLASPSQLHTKQVYRSHNTEGTGQCFM